MNNHDKLLDLLDKSNDKEKAARAALEVILAFLEHLKSDSKNLSDDI